MLKKKRRISGGLSKFFSGDIVSVSYRLNGLGYSFTGICIAIRKKSLLTTNSSVVLRNVFNKVAVELILAVNSVCRLVVSFLDFSRKKFFYRKSKLYYLNKKSNVNSIVRNVLIV